MKTYLKLTIIGLVFFGHTAFNQGTNTPCASGSPIATVLTVGTTCTFSAGTTAGAAYNSNNANGNTPSCASPGAPDVWFQFTAPASGDVTIDLGAGTITDSGMSLYSGTCGAFTELDCDDDSGTGTMSQISSTALTPGATYFIRVWSYDTGTGTFSICVVDDNPPGGTPPANDDPCSATPLTAGVSCSYSTGTNVDATATTGVPAPGCGSYSGGDVWFSVTVPASGNLIFDSDEGGITNGAMAIYSGTCSSLTLITCDNNSSVNGLMPMISQPGLTPGSTIWIRFWEVADDEFGTFEICVYDGGSSVITNDDPCDATVVPVGTSCSFATYTNDGATDSGLGDPGCSDYAGGDVWFQVTVPAAGALTFDSNTGAITDGGMAIYSGTCNALTLIDCSDDDSDNGLMPMIVNNALTPGTTIWIQFWEYGNDDNGSFELCVYENVPPPPPPGNVTCGGMEPICSDTPVTFTASTGGTDADVANPGNDYGCLTSSPNPTWYYLELLAGGTISIDMSAGSDIDFALWGPYPNLATAQASCNSYPAPFDCSYSTAATEQANVPAALANEVYVLLVTNYADVTQVIDLNSGPGNTALTDCSIILPIELVSLSVSVQYAANTLQWKTLSEISNDAFIIERSEDGTHFENIGSVDGAGNSSTEIIYEFADRSFTSDLSYYRLKQIDYDGTVSYSDIVSVNRKTELIVVYPNPSSGNITLQFPASCHGIYSIKFKDTMGKEYLENLEVGTETQAYNSGIFEALPAGIYFVEITDENGALISIQKVLKIK